MAIFTFINACFAFGTLVSIRFTDSIVCDGCVHIVKSAWDCSTCHAILNWAQGTFSKWVKNEHFWQEEKKELTNFFYQ